MKENKLFVIIRKVTQIEEIIIDAQDAAEANKKALGRKIDASCCKERDVEVLSTKET